MKFIRKIIKLSGSLGITIPKDIVEFKNLQEIRNENIVEIKKVIPSCPVIVKTKNENTK